MLLDFMPDWIKTTDTEAKMRDLIADDIKFGWDSSGPFGYTTLFVQDDTGRFVFMSWTVDPRPTMKKLLAFRNALN